MGPTYLFVKAVHVLSIISWMAGLLYLFRLFVNHFEKGQDNESIHQLLQGMERKLYRYITLPAMVASVATGAVMMALNTYLFEEPWMHVKLLGVVLLIGVTFGGGHLVRRFEQRRFQAMTSRYLRILNEVPTLLMILIVAMVILRPF